jgi:hypothetical protein
MCALLLPLDANPIVINYMYHNVATVCPLVSISLFYSVNVWEMLPSQSVLMWWSSHSLRQTAKWDCRISWCKEDAGFASVWVFRFLQCSLDDLLAKSWNVRSFQMQYMDCNCSYYKTFMYCQLYYNKELFCFAFAFSNLWAGIRCPVYSANDARFKQTLTLSRPS